MKNCDHKWIEVGIANTGFGYSIDCPVYWCKKCGKIDKYTSQINCDLYLRQRKKERE